MITKEKKAVKFLDQISIPSILLVSFPESILVALLGIFSIGKFSYFNNRFNFVRLFVFSAISSLFTYFIRRITSNEIEILLVGIILLSLLNIIILRLKFYEAILSSIFGFTIFIVTEMVCLLSLSAIFKIKLDEVYQIDLARFLISLPERVVQSLLVYLSIRYKVKIADLESATVKKKEYYIQLTVYILSIGVLVFLALIMAKTLLYDRGNFTTTMNSLLLRLNIYFTLFITVILTLAIRSIHEFYKNKNSLSNTEFSQNLQYIYNLVDEGNIKEAKDAIETLKHHIVKQ